MKILHYSLGIPGFRSGGLTQYSIDLMSEQANIGHEVFLLYPGEITLSRISFIKKDKTYKNINVYELINPLPVPLTNGVSNPELYYKDMSEAKENYIKWILEIDIDIVHVHTLMGLPLEFIESIKELGIKIIYTTHDYYGICPKVNLVRYDGNICGNNTDYFSCYNCCKNGLSYKKITIMQSRLYRYLKNSKIGNKIISKIKKSTVENEFEIKKVDDIQKNFNTNIEDKYRLLKSYYEDIFRKFDYYHFNSSVTKMVYEKFLGNINGEIITITHSNIKDDRRLKKFDDDKLKIVFLGNDSVYKGLGLLIKALKGIHEPLSSKWTLDIWGVEGNSNLDNISYNGKYEHSMLKEIFNKADLLVIPSICYETFGFIGLEAYSNAMPILTTNTVGFNDLIKNEITGFIVENNLDSIKNKIISLIIDKKQLEFINSNICNTNFDMQMSKHVDKILTLYRKISGRKL